MAANSLELVYVRNLHQADFEIVSLADWYRVAEDHPLAPCYAIVFKMQPKCFQHVSACSLLLEGKWKANNWFLGMEKSTFIAGTSDPQVDTFDIAHESFCKLQIDLPERICAAFLHSCK